MDFITYQPTPLLNTPNFEKVFNETLPFDEQKLVRELEMIALPKMVFQVVKKEMGTILQVKTTEYPSSAPLYLDSRAGKFISPGSVRDKKLRPVDLILERMKSKVGIPYVWGGNYSLGIPEWLKWYPPKKELSPFEEIHWTFRGVDCSGLLYEATEGFTPRNTSELMKFGEEVSLKDVKPLDMIFYKGHVMIALSSDEGIESNHHYGGVRVFPLGKRVSEIDQPFMVRRFHPTFFQTL